MLFNGDNWNSNVKRMEGHFRALDFDPRSCHSLCKFSHKRHVSVTDIICVGLVQVPTLLSCKKGNRVLYGLNFLHC